MAGAKRRLIARLRLRRAVARCSRLGLSLWALVVCAPADVRAGAPVTEFPAVLSGTFQQDDDVALFEFTLSQERSVTFTSYSYDGGLNALGQMVPSGGFDPIVTLFDSFGELIDEADDNEEDFFDFELTLTLDPGTYTVAVTQYDNFSFGIDLAEGFEREGDGNFTIAENCEFPATGPFCDVDGNQRSGFFSFDIVTEEPGNGGGGGIIIDIILVGFEDLSTQTDLLGVFDLELNQQVYQVFDDQQAIVVTATGELAQSAGIEQEGFFNQVFNVSSMAGTPTSPRGSLVIADTPGIGATGGPLAEFFSSPRDLRGATVKALVRDKSAAAAAALPGAPASGSTVRSVAQDVDGKEMATNEQPLSGDFQSMQFDVPDDYTTAVGGALDFDFSRIRRMRWEFSNMAAAAPAGSFDLDDVEVVPELSRSLAQGLAALATLLLSSTRMRRRR